MLTTEAVSQFRPRLSLRGRLYLFSGAILILFAINVGTSLWGSFARNESLIAYQEAVTAAQLTAELEQNLQNKRQQVLVLATLRETTDEPLDAAALNQAFADLEIITERLRQLGGFGGEDLEEYYRRLHESITALLTEWRQFYEAYNEATPLSDVESAVSYNDTQQRLQELDQRQSFVAVQRAKAIDATITLTDQITVIGFIASIAITLALVFAMIRSTNASLTRMKRGVERFGSGDLTSSYDSPSHQITRLGQTSLRSSTVLLTSCTQTQSPTVGSEVQFRGLSSQYGRSITPGSTFPACVWTRRDPPCFLQSVWLQVWTRRGERRLVRSSWTGRDGRSPGPLFLGTLVGLTLG